MTPRTLSLTLVVVIVAAVALAIGVLLGNVLKPVAPAVSPTPVSTFEPLPTLLPSPAVSRTPLPTAEGPPRPTVETHQLIQEAINKGDVSTLKTHVADPVQYVISATECCDPLPRGQALAQLRGALDEGPFDFSPTNPSVQTVRRMATSLEGYVIGVGGKSVLAYRLNARLQIDAIFEADVRLFGIPSE